MWLPSRKRKPQNVETKIGVDLYCALLAALEYVLNSEHLLEVVPTNESNI